MFSWICPRCGRDVPPSKTDCPYCEEQQKELAAQQRAHPPMQSDLAQQSAQQHLGQQGQYAPPFVPPPAPAPPSPRFENPPQNSGQGFAPPYAGGPQSTQQGFSQQPYTPQQPFGQQPQQPQYGQQHYSQPGTWGAPEPKKPMPTWMLSLIFAAAIIAIGSGVYIGIQRFGKTNPQEKAGLENPANPSKARVTNEMQKYVEVVGIRLMTDKKKPAARFLVVNHSNKVISGLEANVTLWASTSRSEEDSVGSFSFKLPHLGATESKELTEPLKTKLKIYELPDWQNANADIQITAP